MEIHLSKTFRKNFKKRVPINSSLHKKYQERLALFVKDRKEPVLKDHKLEGKKSDLRSFWITGDYRVLYFEPEKGVAVLVDIGTHPQVYG